MASSRSLSCVCSKESRNRAERRRRPPIRSLRRTRRRSSCWSKKSWKMARKRAIPLFFSSTNSPSFRAISCSVQKSLCPRYVHPPSQSESRPKFECNLIFRPSNNLSRRQNSSLRTRYSSSWERGNAISLSSTVERPAAQVSPTSSSSFTMLPESR